MTFCQPYPAAFGPRLPISSTRQRRSSVVWVIRPRARSVYRVETIMCDSKTTSSLLIFTLGDRRERARRQLLPTRLGALERDLYRRGLEAAIEAGRACGCRLEVSSPEPLPVASDVVLSRQTGEDFGQRLRQAIHRTEASNPDGSLLVVCPPLCSNLPPGAHQTRSPSSSRQTGTRPGGGENRSGATLLTPEQRVSKRRAGGDGGCCVGRGRRSPGEQNY